MQVYIGDKYGNECPNSKLLYCNVSLIDPLDSFKDPEYVPPDPRTLVCFQQYEQQINQLGPITKVVVHHQEYLS